MPSGTLAGPLEDAPSLDGAEIAVGSKNFSENILLGKIALILLKSAGADVTDLTNIPGSASARQAHLTGDINAMWEYTGTGWLVYLGEPKPIPDETEAVRGRARRRPRAEPARLAAARADEQHLRLRDHPGERGEVRDHEVLGDQQGAGRRAHVLRGVGVPEPRRRAAGVPQDLRGAARREQGRARRQHPDLPDRRDLRRDGEGGVRLRRGVHHRRPDPRPRPPGARGRPQYFPKYNVSLVLREELAEKYPEIEDIIGPVAEKLTDEVLHRAQRQDRRRRRGADRRRRPVAA